MTEKLEQYNQKRNFEKTLEPAGETEAGMVGLRFVIQHHLARRDHYDFRLEWDGVLLSWAVPKGPSYDTHDKRLAVHVEDHPLEYRNFEGTIPQGEYGGGTVMLWDEGYWEPYVDVSTGLKDGALKFVIKGRRLRGKWALVRLKPKAGDTKDNWLLLKERDEFVQSSPGISEFITSIRTGRTIEEIEKGEQDKTTKNPFSRVEVQLAKLVRSIPAEDDWLYELKYDGYRIIAFIEGNHIRLMTRNGNDYTGRFSDVVDSLVKLATGRSMVLDGEMTVTDKTGKTDFQALQNYIKNPLGKKLTYIIFDLLALDGADLREQRLRDRKDTLEELMNNAPKNLYYSRHIKGSGKESLAVACESGMEGIVGKRADSIYSGTRNGDWIKLKCEKRQEFVICGYTLSDKKVTGVSSLILGVYMGEELVYVGRAGTGLSEHSQKELEEKFKDLKRTEAPFLIAPESRVKEQVIWLEPQLVAEIQFAEWTSENLLRQASYKGLRDDKNPKEVKLEMMYHEPETQEQTDQINQSTQEQMNQSGVMIQGIKITNPDKIIFEEENITKEEVIRYYERIAERMLPYMNYRIISAVRCPKGVAGTCFFKKHPEANSKGVVIMPVSGDGQDTEDYFYIENIAGLIAEAQMGTLEFHVWGSRVEELEKPDMIVFDLDPDEGMDISKVRQGVLDVKQILSELSLESYLKTSGGKGYHVVVPLKPSASWEVVHDFAKNVAEVMERKWPDRYTSNVRKTKRAGKIFIDWIRNGRGATSIAPYSIRARKGAKISMPITWEELDTVAPDGIDMTEALRRLNTKNPWNDFFEKQQMLRG